MNELSSYSCPQPGECSGAETDLATPMATPSSEPERAPAPDVTGREESNGTDESSEQQPTEIELLNPRVEPAGEGPMLVRAPVPDADPAPVVPVPERAPVPAPVDAGTASNPECPSAFGESCYRVSTEATTWLEAETDCEVDGGRLAMIGSQEEDEFVGGLLPFSIWLGAISAASPFLFWADGSPFTFSNWAPTQPDILGPLDCIEKRQIEGEPWFDRSCLTNTLWYVCERAVVDLE